MAQPQYNNLSQESLSQPGHEVPMLGKLAITAAFLGAAHIPVANGYSLADLPWRLTHSEAADKPGMDDATYRNFKLLTTAALAPVGYWISNKISDLYTRIMNKIHPPRQPEEQLHSDIKTVQSYYNLKQGVGTEAQTKGYTGLDGYPAGEKLNFQALEFPMLAGSGKAKMLGNNQAFFFVKNEKGNTDPAVMKLDTGNLKKLIRNISDNDTKFTLMLDSDALSNKQRFIDKYQSMRQEPDETTRRALLGREIDLISGFVKSGGIKTIVREVLHEKYPDLPEKDIDHKVVEFLHNNFKLQGVKIDKPLSHAVWQVDGPMGALCAKQAYPSATMNTARPWQIGTEPELNALKDLSGGANSVLESVNEMNAMGKTNHTLGGNFASQVSNFLFHR